MEFTHLLAEIYEALRQESMGKHTLIRKLDECSWHRSSILHYYMRKDTEPMSYSWCASFVDMLLNRGYIIVGEDGIVKPNH